VRLTACIVAVLLVTLMPVAVMAQSLPPGLIMGESAPSSGAPTTFPTLRETLNDLSPQVAVYGETPDLRRFAVPMSQAPGSIAVPA
jgi:hypothetical protein